MIFLRKKTLAFIILYNVVAYYTMYFILIYLKEIHITKGNSISIMKSILINVFPLHAMITLFIQRGSGMDIKEVVHMNFMFMSRFSSSTSCVEISISIMDYITSAMR